MSMTPLVCQSCGVAVISARPRERCPHCGTAYAALVAAVQVSTPTATAATAESAAPAPIAALAATREVSLYDCPVCNEPPRSCTCLRVSVRRKIAVSIERSRPPAPAPEAAAERIPQKVA